MSFRIVSDRAPNYLGTPTSGTAPLSFDTVDEAITFCQANPEGLPYTVLQEVKTVQIGTIVASDPVPAAPAQAQPAVTNVIGG